MADKRRWNASRRITTSKILLDADTPPQSNAFAVAVACSVCKMVAVRRRPPPLCTLCGEMAKYLLLSVCIP